MKTSLRKLRGFASLHKNADLKEKRDYGVPARQDELLQASQDVIEMRNCYDSLLSAAAATANSAYEFSEALREMGTCLLEKTSLNDDEESSRVLLILGKAQFELQKLVDSYRVHIIQTITTPSESLLKELQTVEEMKRQCDDKRDLYKFILAAQREKGRTRHGKGESFESQQLQAARDDYEEEANLFVFRLKSLKQGQSRSLLTQAARHHAAQLNFFRKGVKSLEMLEPHVKVVAEQQHIDYDFIGLEDDGTEDDEDSDYGYDGNDDGELSFDYSHIEHIQDVGSTNRKSMELDQGNVNGTTSATSGTQLASEKRQGDLLSFAKETTTGSQSAPILPEKKFELSERIKQMQASSPMRFHTYVLPTPVDARNSVSAARPDNKGQWPKQLWHSSPLEPNKPAEGLKDEPSSPKKLHISHAVLKDSNIKSGPIQLPPPAERLLLPQSKYNSGVSDSKKIKRQAFSGPLIGKSSSSNPRLFSETIQPADYPPGPSFTAGRIPSPQLSLSPSASPFRMLSSEFNELHELPRPPIISARPVRTSSLVGHSGPLVSRSQGLYATSAMLSNTASPLPTPPPVMARSFSIPSSVQRSGTLTMANFLEDTHNAEVFDEVSSPPLTLISLANNHPPKDPNKLLLVPSYEGSYD
ncbi:hypothetical protein KFK09_000207 [Dendrobium nobile]|uniref:Hydroxyproline-rich glycoprotein family protein n=1 Tax=Dendrobium nobile TaxID=94219 RepID=A0A8T3CE21_DENNO|nr:hypothetical protein KFK09_000207 [Dendrobium nobile]